MNKITKITKIDKGKAFSWRPSPKLKRELEVVARDENASIDAILERAVREWLARRVPRVKKDADQARKRAALMACAGIFRGDGTSATNERVREVVGESLEAKYGRRHSR
jgi:hypothetical protein